MRLGVDLDLAAHDERLVVRGSAAVQLVAATGRSGRRRWCCVSSKPTPAGEIASATRTFTRWPRPAAANEPLPAALAAAAPASTSTRQAQALACPADDLMAATTSSTSTRPRWPMRMILPARRSCPPAMTRPSASSWRLKVGQSTPSGRYAEVTVRDAWSGSANRRKPSAVRPARAARAQSAWRANTLRGALLLEHLECAVERETPRRRPVSTASRPSRATCARGQGRSRNAAWWRARWPPRPVRTR